MMFTDSCDENKICRPLHNDENEMRVVQQANYFSTKSLDSSTKSTFAMLCKYVLT